MKGTVMRFVHHATARRFRQPAGWTAMLLWFVSCQGADVAKSKSGPSGEEQAPQTMTAAQLLAQHLEARAKLQSCRYVLESSTELQVRMTGEPYNKKNGTSRSFERTEFRTDGHRYSVRWRTWGNVKSASDFLSEDRCPYNSLLWDGSIFFNVVATTDTPGRVGIDTRHNVGRYRELISQKQNPLWHFPGARAEQPLLTARSLTLRPHLEQVGQSKCHVLDALTPDAQYTLWLDSVRGCQIVKATMLDGRHSNSNSLDEVVCKAVNGMWIPIEGVVKGSRSYANGDYERRVEHLRITELALNPQHEVLRSFVPDDIQNGAWVQINPSLGDRFNPRDLPLWQDGRVVDRNGRILMNFSRHGQQAQPVEDR